MPPARKSRGRAQRARRHREYARRDELLRFLGRERQERRAWQAVWRALWPHWLRAQTGPERHRRVFTRMLLAVQHTRHCSLDASETFLAELSLLPRLSKRLRDEWLPETHQALTTNHQATDAVIQGLEAGLASQQ